ncbi:MAG: hypothetical protein K0R15_2725 [Clostridiales bacterium]|nr:hypothetical protein [Clostridiales bacterium]
MANIQPFKAIRPAREVVDKVAALPYDVYNRQEAYEELQKEELSFLKIDRAEIQFDTSVGSYEDCVYDRARDTLNKMVEDGILLMESNPCYYIYSLTMNGREQAGIVATASVDDYLNNVIKKHENTRADKEQDRIRHVDVTNANTGPIFLAYRSQKAINDIVMREKEKTPLYDFVSPDGIRHAVWSIEGIDNINEIQSNFRRIDDIYIADGHHRAASAVKVGLKRRTENPGYSGSEEFNYFLSVLFPHDQLMIMSYNRVVMDLNCKDEPEFLQEIQVNFDIEKLGKEGYSPIEKATFGMFLNGYWYKLIAKPEIIPNDPVGKLDVSILQDKLLAPILNIVDPKTDKRIDFVGGIRGLKELEKLMPPKSTWFEPKLRSGIFIHSLL